MTNRPVQNRPTLLDGSDAGGIGISALSVQVSGTPISKKTQRCGERVAEWATARGALPPCSGGSARALPALTPPPRITPHSIQPAALPTSVFDSGLSGVSCGPRAFGSGSPSTAHYAIRRLSCQYVYTINATEAWRESMRAGRPVVRQDTQPPAIIHCLIFSTVSRSMPL